MGEMLMGRQIAYMIYAHFQTDPKMDFTYGIEDLGDLKWHGDHSIPTFLFCWRQIIARVKVKLQPDELAEILYKKMDISKILEVDLAHYNRQDE
eukprot:13511364-Heterocapsa_arctica.AAC.1